MKGKTRCGFCEKPTIPPGVEPIRRSGLPICEECSSDWNKCFPPTISILPTILVAFAVTPYFSNKDAK